MEVVHFVIIFRLLVTLASVRIALGSNILYVMPFGSPSHVNTIVPLLEGLSAKGHNVTLLSPYLPSSALRNPVHIAHLKGLEEIYEQNRPNMFEMKSTSNARLILDFIKVVGIDFCEGLVTHPVFKGLATSQSTPRFEVVIMDSLMSECALSLLPQLGNPPLIFYCTSNLYDFTALALNVPTPFAYVPSVMLSSYSGLRSFSERLINVLSHLGYQAMRFWYIYPMQQAIVNKYFPDTPPLTEIERNASLVFTNSHSPSLDLIRPLAPFVIEVGGTHCRPSKPLSKDVEEFLNASGSAGFIYFSLGSNVRSNELPPEKINAFLGAFQRLKQNVLWKFESNLPNLPSNVQIRKWVSQQDVLGHPNIRLFISHGGQLSTQEAVYHGVPVLGFPVFGDQLINIGEGAARGFVRLLEYGELTEDTAYETIAEMLNNSSYKEKATYYSMLMRDRPTDPLDTAVYWVEYVIRHKGAHHFHFHAAKELNFFQYFLLDVLALLVILLGVTIFSLIYLGKLILRTAFKKSTIVGTQKKRN